MSLGRFDTQQAAGAAHVTERLEFGEIEFFCKCLKVDPRKTGHRADKLLEFRQVFVKLLEYPFLAVLDLVLRFSGAQGLGQVMPELKQAVIQHDQDAAYIPGALTVEIESCSRTVGIARRISVTFALQKL